MQQMTSGLFVNIDTSHVHLSTLGYAYDILYSVINRDGTGRPLVSDLGDSLTLGVLF